MRTWRNDVFERMITLGYNVRYQYWEGARGFHLGDDHACLIFSAACSFGNSFLEYTETK